MIVIMMILMTMSVVRSGREWAGEGLLLEHGVDGEDDYNIVDDYDDDHVDKTHHDNLEKLVADNFCQLVSSKMSRGIGE